MLDWDGPARSGTSADAHLTDPTGRRVVDFADVQSARVGYSVPVDGDHAADRAARHLHSLPDQPDLVPYRTSYYQEAWGFCLSQRVRGLAPRWRLRVVIDTTLADGSLTYGECVIPGQVGAGGACLVPHLPSRRWRTTIWPAIAVAIELARRLARRQALLQLPVRVRARHDRGDHLAGAQRRDGSR